MKRYNVGSLFAGIGGIDLGFQEAMLIDDSGFNLVWANEIDKYACETYRKNFSHTLIQGDINLVLNPELALHTNDDDYEYYKRMNSLILEHRIDVLTGGFPCQAFSIAGEMKGFEDERGNLFWSIINLVKQLEQIHGKPRVLFLENVKNLAAHDKGRTYKVIKSEIEKLGYIVKEQIINTMDFSELPQNRERVYIVCFNNREDASNFVMFDQIRRFKAKRTKTEWVSEIRKIIDFDVKVEDKYYYSRLKYPNYFSSNMDEIGYIAEGKTKNTVDLDKQIDEMYQFYQVRRGMYVRKNKSFVCPTLTANMGTGGHNVPLIRDRFGIRKLTPEETLRLQGFPVGNGYEIPRKFENRPYADANLYKQAGNAVSVPIIRLIAMELLKALNGITEPIEGQVKFELLD